MGMRSRIATCVLVTGLLASGTGSASAATVFNDPVGDSTAAADPQNASCALGCPDISKVTVSQDAGALVVAVDSSSPWGASYPHVVVIGEEVPDGPPTTYGAGIDKLTPGASWT